MKKYFLGGCLIALAGLWQGDRTKGHSEAKILILSQKGDLVSGVVTFWLIKGLPNPWLPVWCSSQYWSLWVWPTCCPCTSSLLTKHWASELKEAPASTLNSPRFPMAMLPTRTTYQLLLCCYENTMTQSNVWKKKFILASGSRWLRVCHGRAEAWHQVASVEAGSGSWGIASLTESMKHRANWKWGATVN